MRSNQVKTEISKAVKSYLDGGGEITRVPGFEFQPRPARTEPARLRVNALEKSNNTAGKSLAGFKPDAPNKKGVGPIINTGHAKRIVALASAGLSVIQISNRTNVPRNAIRDLAKQMGFSVAEVALCKKTLSGLGRAAS